MATNMDEVRDPRGNRTRMVIWGFAVALFLLPLVAKQVVDGMAWTGFDFLVWGAMLLVACGACELVRRMSRDRDYRMGAGVAIAAAFLVFWVNGAVGMIGTEGNAYNLLFLGAIALGGLGTLLARFRAGGIVWALYATTAAHAAVSLVALAAGWDPLGSLLSLAFAVPWLVAARLFAKAAQRQPLPQ
jgi:hypothetical protein